MKIYFVTSFFYAARGLWESRRKTGLLTIFSSHRLISAVKNPSPVVTFAKAAFLGLSTKGDLSSCQQVYSTCPKDPDKLVQYLNNYNGGFFRFFSGIPKPYPVQASKRILNNYADPGDQFTFHAGLRSPKTVTFPSDKETMYQRPPIGHVKVPMVFPDRTGTGELRLDVDELAASNNELYGDYDRFKFNKVFRFPTEDLFFWFHVNVYNANNYSTWTATILFYLFIPPLIHLIPIRPLS